MDWHEKLLVEWPKGIVPFKRAMAPLGAVAMIRRCTDRFVSVRGLEKVARLCRCGTDRPAGVCEAGRMPKMSAAARAHVALQTRIWLVSMRPAGCIEGTGDEESGGIPHGFLRMRITRAQLARQDVRSPGARGPRAGCEGPTGCCGCPPGEVLRDWESPNSQPTPITQPGERPERPMDLRAPPADGSRHHRTGASASQARATASRHSREPPWARAARWASPSSADRWQGRTRHAVRTARAGLRHLKRHQSRGVHRASLVISKTLLTLHAWASEKR